MEDARIFVRLLDEGVDVWRPIQAKHLRGKIYRIVEQPYDTDVETWEFEPGSEVICETLPASDGQMLAAVCKHNNST